MPTDDFPPERTVEQFKVRVYCPIKKKWYTARWKMTREDAARHFGDTQYEILEHTRELQVVGGDPSRLWTGWFLNKPEK